jgi:hypothetical protein
MKFSRNSIETHLTQQHQLCLSQFELEYGRLNGMNPIKDIPVPASHSNSPNISYQQPQIVQHSGQQDHPPTAAHRSPQPHTSAQQREEMMISPHPVRYSLLEKIPVSSQAWMPVPQLRHAVGQVSNEYGEFRIVY